MVSTTDSLISIILVFGVANAQTTQKMTECISRFSSCSDACPELQSNDETCKYSGDTNGCGWPYTKSQCICDCSPKSSTIDYASKEYGLFDKVVKAALDKVKDLACVNEEEMWLTLALSPAFLDNIMEETQKAALYDPVRKFALAFPQFLDYAVCESDFYIRNYIAKIPGVAVTETMTNGGKADKTSTDIEDLLQPIYTKIKPQIDVFASSLPVHLRKTAMAVTYTANACLDVKFEICYAVGYGFAYDFKGGLYYYQTGVQALTLQASDDFSKLPGSVSFDVAYDVLGEIDYAPGNLYSLDAAISAGIIGKLANSIVAKVKDSQHENVKSAFIGGGYGLSYLVGVDSLALNQLKSTKCLGISFSHALTEISGGIIPSASFGISRVATVTSTNIKELEEYNINDNNGLLTSTITEDEKNKCVAEQLWSISFGFIRPDLELSSS